MATTRPSPIAANDSQVALALVLVAGAAWLYLGYMAWGMAHMDRGAAMLLMPAMTQWEGTDVALVFLMWVIMMAAMMLPSAAPMVRMFARCCHTRPGPPTAAFVAGYLTIWTGLSAMASLAQWGLLELRLITPMMESASRWLSGGLLVGAGIFQLTPLKDSCLSQCRSPLGFLMTEWRPGLGGAFRMGLRHGSYCAGCCALLMLLLFVLGVMNLAWIAVLSLVVLAEKTLWTEGVWPSRALGAALTVWGGYVLVAAPG